jgi:thioredoxin 1
MTEPKVLKITEENFSEAVSQSKPILIDFWAAWCGPCQTMNRIVQELGAELADQLSVGKLNVDEQPTISQALGVQTIPTFILFKANEELARFYGAQPKSSLKNQVTKKLNATQQ